MIEEPPVDNIIIAMWWEEDNNRNSIETFYENQIPQSLVDLLILLEYCENDGLFDGIMVDYVEQLSQLMNIEPNYLPTIIRWKLSYYKEHYYIKLVIDWLLSQNLN